jgi:hypothetical protein
MWNIADNKAEFQLIEQTGQAETFMRWAKTTLRNSFFGWLGHAAPAVPPEKLDSLRKAMLDALGDDVGEAHTALERKLLFAKDIGELWYSRPELMNALAARVGEARARETLFGVTRLFDGLKPGA